MSANHERIIDVPAGTEVPHAQTCRATKVIIGGVVVKDRFGAFPKSNDKEI